MTYKPLQLNLRSNQARDASINSARLINGWADDLGSDAAIRNPIYACDGHGAYATLTTAGTHNGMFTADGADIYVHNGTAIYRVNASGVTSIETGVTAGAATFAANGAGQIIMTTSGGLTRLITPPTTVTTPSFDPAISAPLFNSVCQIDGYFVWTRRDGEFYLSDINSTTVDPLQFARGATNGLSRGVRRGRDVMLSGRYETSFWQNTGQADFALQRLHVATYGVHAAPAMVPLIATIDNTATDTVIWPATGPGGDYIGVAMLAGYDARIISTGEIDRLVKSESSVSTIRAHSYTSQSQTFYSLSGSSWTYEYNVRTGLWHQRIAAGGSAGPLIDAVDIGGVVVAAPPGSSAALYRLRTDLVPGAATNLALRVSKDSGSTWSAARTKAIGGARATRTSFNRLGQSREDGFQFELKLTNSVVEGASAADLTIVTPAVGAWPARTTCDALYVDCVPGVSGTAGAKAALRLGIDMRQDAA